MLQLLKCLEIELSDGDASIETKYSLLVFDDDELDEIEIEIENEDVSLIAPSTLFELIQWLSPAFHSLELYIDDDDDSQSQYTQSDIINVAILLSEKYEEQMIECRLVSLLRITEFKSHIFPDGLLKDIMSVIVEFELGMTDIYESTVRFLNSEIFNAGIASHVAYILGIYESWCMFCVILMHCFAIESVLFESLIFGWSACLTAHIIGAILLWKGGHSIANRLKQLKLAMRLSSLKNENALYGVNDYDEKDFEDIHVGEAFVRLQRWCNLTQIRLNDKFNSIKILMLVLQKYILPLSISLCILIDPNGSKWYGYISILLYYLHLHILYEIFHNERHAMVAFARVTLFWGIFISIVAAIASATSSPHASAVKSSSSSSSSQEANFLAGLAGLLLFGIFIAVFDVCWFFSENPAKKRLIFFVILVNFCYIGGCFYMFAQSVIIIAFFFTISLVHCQIVFNQIIDCVLYGDVDQYLDLRIADRFFINAYYQSFCGMTHADDVEPY